MRGTSSVKGDDAGGYIESKSVVSSEVSGSNEAPSLTFSIGWPFPRFAQEGSRTSIALQQRVRSELGRATSVLREA